MANFTAPSGKQHPPNKKGVGGVHDAGKLHKIDGGHMAGNQAAVHPSLKKTQGKRSA
ncbi:MAG TPA: hypothetical protein VFB50_12375 [Chloroflexota bacterium]|nr:hypothetical protein [Chloroflexota bacterium]